MKKISIVITALLFFAAANNYAQNSFDKEKLDIYFNTLEKFDKAMFSVSILKDGEIVYNKAVGYASVEDKKNNNILTKFRIGSISKMFTSSMIFQLIEEGKLKLDSKLSEFFPSVTNAEVITISDMLCHRSGIYNFTNDPKYLEYYTSAKLKDEILAIISSYNPIFEPDSKTEYSNSNYVLLGFILEDLTGLSYKENLKTRITDRIKLNDTFYGSKIDHNNNEAFSYKYLNGWELQPETDLSIPHGAGSVVSTSDDLVKFIYSLFSEKVVSKKSLDEMTVIKERIGKGILEFPFYEKRILGHNGGIDGFVSSLGYFPEDKTAFAILTNGMNYNFNDILIGMLSIYFGKPFEIPDMSSKEISFSENDFTKYIGVYKSSALPLKIEIKIMDGKLFGQATGQSAFPMTPFSLTEFRFDPAGVIIMFEEAEKDKDFTKFVLLQGGGNFPFERE